LTLDGALGAGVQRLLLALLEVGQAFGHGVICHGGERTGVLPRR
jgi:hypothetical protein